MSTDTTPHAPPRVERRALEGGGYMLSSIDLSRGLDVSALAISALPHDVLRELTRLRRCWEVGSSGMPGSAAA